jgi:hypothetical protein
LFRKNLTICALASGPPASVNDPRVITVIEHGQDPQSSIVRALRCVFLRRNDTTSKIARRFPARRCVNCLTRCAVQHIACNAHRCLMDAPWCPLSMKTVCVFVAVRFQQCARSRHRCNAVVIMRLLRRKVSLNGHQRLQRRLDTRMMTAMARQRTGLPRRYCGV